MKQNVFIVIMSCLCLGTLFLSTPLLVNAQVTPKWYFAIVVEMLSALIIITFSFSGQNTSYQNNNTSSDILLEQQIPEELLPP